MREKEKKFLRRAVLFSITLIGVILVWRGVWELSTRLFDSETSLILGAVILFIVGAFFRKFLMKNLL